MSVNNYFIRIAYPNEQAALVKFVLQHGHMEGIDDYLSNHEHGIEETEKITEDRAINFTKAISKNLCFVAIHSESQDILGMILSLTEKNPKLYEISDDSKNSVLMRSKVYADYRKYVLNPIHQMIDVFAQFPKLDTVLKLQTLCVHSNYRGQGIATSLINQAVEYAKDNNINLVCGMFGSPASQKAAKKNEFQVINSMDLVSLRDEDENIIFKNLVSHTILAMIKCLQPIV